MTEAIPTLRHKTSKPEFGTSCTAHDAKLSARLRNEKTKNSGAFAA